MDIPMVISKWTPYAEEAQPAMKSIQLWVTLTDVPLSMFTDKGLEFLSSAVGRPKRLHPKTEACVSFDEAQILVEADLTKDLPKEYVFTGEEEGELDAVVKYSYPWLPPRCSCSEKWGHSKDSCLAIAKRITPVTPSSTQAPITETEQEHSRSSQALAVTGKEHIAENKIPSEEKTEMIPLEGKTEEKGDDGQGWITPTTSNRSPGKKKHELKFGEVSILSNAYSVLSGKGEPGEEFKTGETEIEEEDISNSIQVPPGEAEQSKAFEDSIRGNKTSMLLRQSLPRGSKTAHKAISAPSTQSTRKIPRDQSKRTHPKHH